jgi:hypothetical protein
MNKHCNCYQYKSKREIKKIYKQYATFTSQRPSKVERWLCTNCENLHKSNGAAIIWHFDNSTTIRYWWEQGKMISFHNEHYIPNLLDSDYNFMWVHIR